MDINEWERQLHNEIDAIRRSSQHATDAAIQIRGRGEVRGVLVEIDADANITTLQIAPAAMRWSAQQLSNAVVNAHRTARKDAKQKVKQIIREADPRIRGQLSLLRDDRTHTTTQPQPTSEAEIQAADDAYFERRNREGWS